MINMQHLDKFLASLDHERDPIKRVEMCEVALASFRTYEHSGSWAALHVHLGDALRLIPLRERAGMLERAIEHYQVALAIYTREKLLAECAATQFKLANSYYEHTRGDRADNLEQAIAHYEEALALYTSDAFAERRGAVHNNLANAYSDRIRGDRADNLEQAIAHYEEALTVYTRDAFPIKWAVIQNNLAGVHRDRMRGKRPDNLEQAIDRLKAALTIYSREASPAYWAGAQHNLAAAYWDRIHGERAENLERAIGHYQQALTVYTRETFPEQWALTQNNLANTWARRIRGELADNLDRAIEHYQEALTVYTREAFSERWAMAQHNLASAYRHRVRGGRAENLERAIEHYKAALTVRTPEAFPTDWAMTQNNLANAYWNRVRGERAENLERAIEHYKAALTVRTPEAFPADWAMTQNNLGLAYSNRIRGEKADNLDRAIEHFGQALTAYSPQVFPTEWAITQHNLANAHRDRIRGDRADNLQRAIEHFGQALTVHSRQALPADFRRTQRNLGDLHFGREDWAHAHDAFSAAIEAGADLLAAAYTEIGRRSEVGETAGLYADDAYTLLRLGCPGDALARLEQGKTRLLNSALALGTLGLTKLAEADQEAMRSARQAVRELEAEMRLPADTPARRGDRDLADALRQARADVNRLIERIRTEHPEFMPTGLDLPGILDVIPEGGALVAPLFTSKGSAVFVLPHGTAAVTSEHVIELERFTTANLGTLLHGAEGEPEPDGWLGAYANSRADRQPWLAAIETTGLELWESLIGPVHERLVDFGLTRGAPVLLMPQGGLGMLPLHAAWRDVDGQKRCFLDDWSVIYAPSGYALSVSRERREDTARQGQALLAIVNPTQDLPFTPAEAEAVMTLFADARALEAAAATVDAVTKAAPGRQYLHFSGHGFYNWQNALRSGLVMADGPLTLAAIISDLDLSACRLVTLSACETGITDIRQSPDEFLGLPAGLLQAGAVAVVSTLWPVNDLSTMLLMERFYKHLLADNHRTPHPAAALRAAQLWLRDATAGGLKLAERWRQLYETTSDPELAKTAFRNIRYFANHQDEKPFTSAYYWAGFTLVGE